MRHTKPGPSAKHEIQGRVSSGGAASIIHTAKINNVAFQVIPSCDNSFTEAVCVCMCMCVCVGAF